jgi:hypothetical protein
LLSPSFTKPFICIGALRVFSQWGEMAILMVYMITIFKQSKSSIEPELAPVFVGVIQVRRWLPKQVRKSCHKLRDSFGMSK